MLDKFKFNLEPKINQDGEFEMELPFEMFDGWEVRDAKTKEFLGWVNAKEKKIQMFVVNEIVHVNNKEDDKK